MLKIKLSEFLLTAITALLLEELQIWRIFMLQVKFYSTSRLLTIIVDKFYSKLVIKVNTVKMDWDSKHNQKQTQEEVLDHLIPAKSRRFLVHNFRLGDNEKWVRI